MRHAAVVLVLRLGGLRPACRRRPRLRHLRGYHRPQTSRHRARRVDPARRPPTRAPGYRREALSRGDLTDCAPARDGRDFLAGGVVGAASGRVVNDQTRPTAGPAHFVFFFLLSFFLTARESIAWGEALCLYCKHRRHESPTSRATYPPVSGTSRPAIGSTCVPVTGRGACGGVRAIGVREPWPWVRLFMALG